LLSTHQIGCRADTVIGDYLKGLRYQLVERACETMNLKSVVGGRVADVSVEDGKEVSVNVHLKKIGDCVE